MRLALDSYPLSDFDFPLPSARIAQQPRAERDGSRLLVWQSRSVRDSVFRDFAAELRPGDLVVRNNSRVFAARVAGWRRDDHAPVEITALEPPVPRDTSCRGRVLARPSRRLSEGTELEFPSAMTATVSARHDAPAGGPPHWDLTWDATADAWQRWSAAAARLPLPPYIKRQDSHWDPLDRDRYQTIYAKTLGSAAAPTAGLHFTPAVEASLRRLGVGIAELTLHVGVGTFAPIRVSSVAEHRMHREPYLVPAATWDQIRQTRRLGGRIVAIGTTTLRCLSSFAEVVSRHGSAENLVDRWHDSELFIYPRPAKPYWQPPWIDALVTNFHQPCSTLFMLVCALLGTDEAQRVYREAAERGYRFLSYGDTSLLKLAGWDRDR